METTEQVLVIFLSGALAIFLVLGIIVLIKVIQILNYVKRITEKAERFADKAEAVGEFFQRTTGPVVIGKLLAHMFETVFKRQRNNRTRRSKR